MKKIIIVSIMASILNIAAEAQSISDFRLKDTKNNFQTFSDLKGEKITLIDFWTTWCGPCMKAVPEINKIFGEYESKGVQVIGINCDGPRSASKVAPMVNSLQIKYPVLTDIESGVMNDLNLNAFPTLLLVDGAGKILWIHEGFVSGDADIIKSEIEKYL